MSWKRGQSGNLAGRPKRALTEILIQRGDDMINYKGDALTRKEVLGLLLWHSLGYNKPPSGTNFVQLHDLSQSATP